MNWESFSIEGASFHFGKHGMGQEESAPIFSSDSLFAAMVSCASLAIATADFNRWLESFQTGDPPFLLTSAFPRAGAIRFFPLPLSREKLSGASAVSLKQIKKTAFVSENLFRKILDGAPLEAIFAEGKALQNGLALISAAEEKQLPEESRQTRKLWELIKRPRVTLGRIDSASMLYFTGLAQFTRGCGLWFAVQHRETDADRLRIFTRVLQELSIQGLGGERSAGLGQCEITPSGTFDLPTAGSGRWLTLSRYLPAPDEPMKVFGEGAAFAIESVGGWLNSPGVTAERRKTVNMLTEGSVLSCANKELIGSMADVQPDYGGTRPVGHPVWRNGFAAPVGLPAKTGRLG